MSLTGAFIVNVKCSKKAWEVRLAIYRDYARNNTLSSDAVIPCSGIGGSEFPELTPPAWNRGNASPTRSRRVLRLADLDHSKLAVLNSLTSLESRWVYEFAIEQFITWYCSEPRLAFNRIVVVRYRIQLEARSLAAATIDQRLAAVRRLAHEAADSGLLSPELAQGFRE